jgi:uncharacterized repeat protein (TIGR01451 family)
MSCPGLSWRIAGASLLLLAAFPAAAATVSGTVVSPTSDNGYRAALDDSVVRVEGTALSVPVQLADRFNGTFTLADVPAGAVTLIFEERAGYQAFTHASIRLPLTVAGDVSGVAFALQPHWRSLPSYPPPYHDGNYDIWQPFFVSDQVGFMLFWGRWLPTPVHELWRTVDGGGSWARIGLWNPATDAVVPTQQGENDLFFADADHGVVSAVAGGPAFVPVGLLSTADGGGTWTHLDLPNAPGGGAEPAANGRITLVRYAGIDARHWIACGSENVGSYMGSGTPGWVTVWETADAGASWFIATSWREDYGTCSALNATPDGHAILFDTPYAFGGTRRLMLRSPAGAWTQVTNSSLVTNSGYGGADVPMVGATAFVRAQLFDETASEVDRGLYRSTDWGASWLKISDALPLYLAFATERTGYGTSGPTYATYDGGLTWLVQSEGGGQCCHGDRIWAFGVGRAIWQDGGVGDPDGVADVFTYADPAAPDLEVRRGVAIADAVLPARAQALQHPVLALRLDSHGPADLRLAGLTVRASGTGDDHTQVGHVRLWWDRDGDGAVGGGDTELAAATYAADDGAATLAVDPAAAPVLRLYQPVQLLVTYDLAAQTHFVTYRADVAAAEVVAEVLGAAPASVAATAPPGAAWRGAALTIDAHADLRVSQADSPDPVTEGDEVTYQITVHNAGPDDAAEVTVTDDLPAGAAFVSATPSQGSCAPTSGGLGCALGTLAYGATATVSVVARPDAPGTATNQVTVSAVEPDPAAADNGSIEATTVTAREGGGGGGGGCGNGSGGAEGLAALLALLSAGARRCTGRRERRGWGARAGPG